MESSEEPGPRGSGRDRVENPGRRTRACRSRPARRYRTDTGNAAIDRWHAEDLVASSRPTTADAGASLHGYFHFEQFLRVSESNLFLVFAWQIDSAEPVGLLLYVRERIVGCEHHSIHAYVLQQESE